MKFCILIIDIVRVGGEEQKTRALGGTLNPEFKKDTSTFTFDVRSAFRILYYRQFHHILQHFLSVFFCHYSIPFFLTHPAQFGLKMDEPWYYV